jgi:nitroimidazol reductase NimA-like FMN-containing flavoprotein (pyridoxamine 5'-phosphate oxidase superfamily)
MLNRLSEEEARKLLARERVGRLGCITDDGPYIVPINYYFADDCVYSHSLPGLKVDALRKDPRTCLQVDEVESELHWKSVLAFGRYEEVKSNERSEVINKLLQRFLMLTPVESALADDGGPQPVIVFRIRIERVTGLSEE